MPKRTYRSCTAESAELAESNENLRRFEVVQEGAEVYGKNKKRVMTDSPDVPAAPVALMSYSHDSPEHKRWVGELAAKLVKKGVDVILDQWNTGPGDDLPKFMERAVGGADRVLMICTDAYVQRPTMEKEASDMKR